MRAKATVKAMQKASKSHPPAAFSGSSALTLNPLKGSSPCLASNAAAVTALAHSHSYSGPTPPLAANTNANASRSTYMIRYMASDCSIMMRYEM